MKGWVDSSHFDAKLTMKIPPFLNERNLLINTDLTLMLKSFRLLNYCKWTVWNILIVYRQKAAHVRTNLACKCYVPCPSEKRWVESEPDQKRQNFTLLPFPLKVTTTKQFKSLAYQSWIVSTPFRVPLLQSIALCSMF